MKDYSKITTRLGITLLLVTALFFSLKLFNIIVNQNQTDIVQSFEEDQTVEDFNIITEDNFHQELAKKPVGTKEIASPYAEITYLGKEQVEGGEEIDKFQAEFTILPKAKADLTPIDATWYRKEGKWVAGENLFSAIVKDKEIYMEALNDQPYSVAKAGDSLTYNPQLFVGDEEYKALGEPTILSTDPINENYQHNTLEWDYGVAKRRLRIIEGNMQGSWIFNEDPKAEVRIKYNQKGKLALNLGGSSGIAEGISLKVAVADNDEEVVPADQFAQAESYPVSIADSSTFYPDADPENTSVDGYVGHEVAYGSGYSWTDLVGASGDKKSDTIAYYQIIDIQADNVADDWIRIHRGIFLFDTSALPDGSIISVATLSLFGYSKSDGLGIAPDINIYSSAPATNTAIANGDFDSLGTVAFSSAIAYGSWDTTDYNDFVLNSDGRAAISKTGVSKFGARNANYDVAEALDPGNHAPNWSSAALSQISCYLADQGEGWEPKLVITYTLPWQPRPGGVSPGGSGGFFIF